MRRTISVGGTHIYLSFLLVSRILAKPLAPNSLNTLEKKKQTNINMSLEYV